MWLLSLIRKNIGLKVLLYLSLPAIATFVAFTLIALSYVRQAAYREYQQNARGIVWTVKSLLAPGDIANPEHFQAAAKRVVKGNPEIIKLHLHLPRGSHVYTAVSTLHDEVGKTGARDALALKTRKDVVIYEGDMVEVHTPVFVKGRPVAVIGVYLSTVEEKARLAKLIRYLLVLGATGGTFLAGVMYLAFTRTILHPLARLEGSTKKLALGNYEPVVVDRDDELGRLARHFNFMLETIARKEDETKALYHKLERSYKQARSEAITDELTGLYNYRYFRARLTEEVSRADRKFTSVALAFIDIDNFKKFNDEFGHQDGDKALRIVANIVKSHIRAGDLAARYGGEELVVIFPETVVDKAASICERIRTEVEQLQLESTSGCLEELSVSIGVAAYPDNATSAKMLIQVADKCMYQAKKQGKNKVVAASFLVGTDSSILPA